MSVASVGLDNLPNVYFESITISPLDKDLLKIRAKIIVNDYYNELGESVWSDDNLLVNNMKTIFVVSYSESTTSKLSSGAIALVPHSLKNETDLKYQILKTIMARNEEQKISEAIQYNLFFDCDVPKNQQHLTFFAACYSDATDLSKNYSVDFLSGNRLIYTGPVSSEKIIENSKVVQEATIFRNDAGTLYKGPVHFHDTVGYMAGSQHSLSQHDSLTVEKIPNFKIKDYRQADAVLSKREVLNNSSISDLEYTFDEDTNTIGIFSVDFRKMLMAKTKYGNFIARAEDSLVEELYKKIIIKKLIINRQRVNLSLQSTSIGSKKIKTSKIGTVKNIVSTYDDKSALLKPFAKFSKGREYNLVESDLPSEKNVKIVDKNKIYKEQLSEYRKISSVKELFLQYDKFVRTFQFTDYTTHSKMNGKFKYTVDIEFVDPTNSFINELIRDMKTQYSQLELYLRFLSKKSNYDYINNKSKIASYSGANLNTIVDNYTKFYSYMYKLEAKDYFSFTQQNYSLIDPKNATLTSVKKFIQKFFIIQNEFLRILDINDFKYQKTKRKIYIKNNPNVNRIEFGKVFEAVIVPSTNSVNLNYLNKTAQGTLTSFTKDQFSIRTKEEIDKFYNQNPNFSTQENISIDKETLSKLSNIGPNSSTYFSPSSISDENSRMKLNRIEQIDIKKFNKIINKRQALHKKISYKQKPKKETTNNLNANIDEQYLDSREILGDGSKFVSYTKVLGDTNVSAETLSGSSDLTNAIEYEDAPSQSISDYDLLNPNNLITSVNNVEDLPMQLKALFGSRLLSTNNNFSNSNIDFVASPETKALTDLNFKNLQVLEVLERYEKDKNGFIDFSKPVYKEMNSKYMQKLNKPMMCKLKKYNNRGLNIRGYNKIDLSIVNKIFILSDKDVSQKVDDRSFSFKTNYSRTGDIGPEYATTNIVTQGDFFNIFDDEEVPAGGRQNQRTARIEVPERNRGAY